MTQFFQTLEGLPSIVRGGAVAIGNFDGVHRGHRSLVSQLRQLADRLQGPAIVLTFDPPPAALLYPDSVPPALTWMERRSHLLGTLGVDVVIACPTTPQLLRMEPEEFFHQVLREKIGAEAFVEGPNFRFGHNRRGDIRLLEQLARAEQCEFSLVLAETSHGSMLSSSRIRQLLQQGNLEQANEMLVEPYRLRGCVEAGAGRGRGIGFPTANIGKLEVMTPGFGVYGGRVWLEGQVFRTAVNIGANPTFGESHTKIEAHLLDFDQDIYGRDLELELVVRLRDTKRFASIEHLQDQLRNDLRNLVERVPLS